MESLSCPQPFVSVAPVICKGRKSDERPGRNWGVRRGGKVDVNGSGKPYARRLEDKSHLSPSGEYCSPRLFFSSEDFVTQA